MKTKPNKNQARGFALIVTLTLMILLTVIAVGLLTLSSISLRSASQGQAMASARANARFALMLAIGELQKNAGPDQRVTAPANLMDEDFPAGVTGVWESWSPDPNGTNSSDYTDKKIGDYFLGYLISDPSNGVSTPDTLVLPGDDLGDDQTIRLVREIENSGNAAQGANREINAPLVFINTGSNSDPNGAYAWVAMDENVKARIDLAPALEAQSLGERITRLGSSARNQFKDVKGLKFLDGTDLAALREELPKLISLKTAERAAEEASSNADFLSEYFHDITVSSASLQTNVADGGLKTDLSVLFDGEYREELPGDWDDKFLYSDTQTPFQDSNSDIPWSVYANYSRLYRLSSSDDGDPLSGLVARLPDSYKLNEVDEGSFERYEPEMSILTEPVMMPTVVRVDIVFSMVARRIHSPHSKPSIFKERDRVYMLHLMYLPIITLHNPFNTTLRCENLKVEFSDIPIGFRFYADGKPFTNQLAPLNSLYKDLQNGATEKVFGITLSDDLGSNTEIVMGPGETRIFGTPFPHDRTWRDELGPDGSISGGAVMFDWKNNLTDRDARITPGLVFDGTSGIGFDVDTLAPSAGGRTTFAAQRSTSGIAFVESRESIHVEFGPVVPQTANGGFRITTTMDGRDVGKSIIYYENEGTLQPLLEEGTSDRFTEARDFPITFPIDESPIRVRALIEGDTTEFSKYAKARPIAIFSIGGKTTMESFTKGRPLADTGMAFQMTTSDLSGKDSQGATPLEFALVPVTPSNAIESDEEKGFFFGGAGSQRGTTTAALYEVPLAPLQSLAQLRNANATSLGASPLVTYSVGESRAHPAINPSKTYSNEGSSIGLDHAWLANSTLWDGYWFSTLSTLAGPAYSGAAPKAQSALAEEFFAGDTLLPNPRNQPYVPSGKPGGTAEVATDSLTNEGKNSAAYILTEGGFNVNSTSVLAWKSVLSALANSEIPIVTGDTTETSDETPFPRFRRPILGASGGEAGVTQKLWNAYRTVTDLQIETLAEEIVEQVKLRGPFLSMSEFVNRRLGPSDELTNNGAIQAALDETEINESMLDNARKVTAEESGAYGWVNPDAATGNTGAGSPGEVSQGDILSAIGSYITVRADTFSIRAYGDARDPKGKILASAWCEATVQRVPDYVDTTDAPESVPASTANIEFGRRFRIVSFRWLSRSEIFPDA